MTEPATSHARELRDRNQERAERRNRGHIIAAEVRRRSPPGPPAVLRHKREHDRARYRPHRESVAFLAAGISQDRRAVAAVTTAYTETARVVRDRNQYAATLVYLADDGYSDPRRSPYYIP